MTNKQMEKEILYQGLNWYIGVDGCYINHAEKEPILNHLYEVALACRDKAEQLERKKAKLRKIEQFLMNNVCLETESCVFCDNINCINKDILNIIKE